MGTTPNLPKTEFGSITYKNGSYYFNGNPINNEYSQNKLYYPIDNIFVTYKETPKGLIIIERIIKSNKK